MKLLAYTIGGQKIGVDIQTWNDTMLSGNTAFLAIADTGSTPTNYVDISSVSYWDVFGSVTILSPAEIKNEIIKLIPDVPSTQEYEILEGYMNVGINSMTNINNSLSLSSQLTDGYLSGVTDTKFNASGGSLGTICGVSGTLNVDGNFNVGGSSAVGGNSTVGGSVIVGGNMSVTGTITNPAVDNVITGATNLGIGEGISSGVTNFSLQIKSLIAGTDVTLVPDANSITINATGGGTGGTITTYSATDTGGVTTTSATDVLMTGMQINSVPAGDYFVSFGTSLSHSANGDGINTTIYVGGTAITNSEMYWKRGNAQGDVDGTHNYSNYPITVAATGTVEIRWKTDGATATSTNRYMTLLKVG